MNYKIIYNQLIANCKNKIPTGYYEIHHIIPRSLGGDNSKENLIKLSTRDHFIAHALLAKIYPKYSDEWYKMQLAFKMMTVESVNKRYINSRLYISLRQNFSLIMSNLQMGSKNSQYGTIWISNENLKKSIKHKKNNTIPDGWIIGRKMWKEIDLKENCCKHCNKTFESKRNLNYCSKFCRINNRPSVVKDNFENLYSAYLKNGKVSYKAFQECNIAFNGNLVKQFLKLIPK